MVTHAFPRAGVYTVVETIVDKDQKSAQRPHPRGRSSVATWRWRCPAQVRAVLLAQKPWARIEVHRAVAEKLRRWARSSTTWPGTDRGGGGLLIRSIPRRPKPPALDPDEGVALYTVPEEPESLVFAVGTSDDKKALETAKRVVLAGQRRPLRRRLLRAAPMRRSSDSSEVLVPDRTPRATRSGSCKRSAISTCARPARPIRRSEGACQQRGGAAAREGPLRRSGLPKRPPPHRRGRRHLLFAQRRTGSGNLGRALLGPLVVHGAGEAATIRQDLLQLRMFALPRTLTGEKLAAAFTPEKPPPDLAAQLPAGAAAYLRISAAPQSLWSELTRSAGADTARIRDRIAETTGLDLEKDPHPQLLPATSASRSISTPPRWSARSWASRSGRSIARPSSSPPSSRGPRDGQGARCWSGR